MVILAFFHKSYFSLFFLFIFLSVGPILFSVLFFCVSFHKIIFLFKKNDVFSLFFFFLFCSFFVFIHRKTTKLEREEGA